MAQVYDVIVIGAGPGGYVAAIRASQLGLKVGIVEKDARLGGTCLLRGCIPTKALLESAYVYEKAQSASKFGVKVSGVELDFAGVQSFREKTVDTNSKGVQFLMKKNKIDVLKGHGRVKGQGVVSVTAADGKVTEYQTKNTILATGSVCKDLPFIQMDHVRTVNSDDILEIKRVPKSLIVMGAGAVGSEFASVYRSFGADVTLIEYQDRLLPIEDDDISKELLKAYKKRGINVKTSTAVKTVELVEGGVKVNVEAAAGGSAETLEAEMLLVAVGRAPVTGDLGLDSVGVAPDQQGFIPVDKYCRTNVPGLYAIGDIIRTPALAHIASHEAIMVAELIAGKEVHAINYDHTPNCTYCEPEVASVGLTEREARARGYEVKVGTFSLAANGKARIMGADGGLVKIISDARYDEVLGAHIIGPKATELISEIGAALQLESTTEELVRTIHPHPTLAESIGEAALALLNGSPVNA